jgi:hypothetical protein
MIGSSGCGRATAGTGMNGGLSMTIGSGIVMVVKIWSRHVGKSAARPDRVG